MLISSFLPSTGGQGPEQGHFKFNSQAEEQDSLKQAIVNGYNDKNNAKQVKETVPHAVRIGFSCSNTNTYTNNIFSSG